MEFKKQSSYAFPLIQLAPMTIVYVSTEVNIRKLKTVLTTRRKKSINKGSLYQATEYSKTYDNVYRQK